jgi:AbrB family looped-hinge helix DNA binding protein
VSLSKNVTFEIGPEMNQVLDVRVANNGRMVLPKSVREALGVSGGGAVILSVEGGVVTLTSLKQSISHAQDLYRHYVTQDQSSDDFIQERRQEAAREGRA